MALTEAYKGTDLVGWHGKIERHLNELREKYDSQKNRDQADKIAEFLRMWRAHPITGSINIEDITPLEASASTLAVDKWKLSGYFTALRDRLRAIIASAQELPDGAEPPPATGRSTRMSPGRPPSTFGAEKMPGEADKFAPDVKFDAKQRKAAQDQTPDNPEAEAPEPDEFKESVSVQSARYLSTRYGQPLTLSEVQSNTKLNYALSQGWLTYSYDTGYYYGRLGEDIMNAATDAYDIGDTVITTHNGKPITGSVSRKRPDGSYELSFSKDERDAPVATTPFKKDQLRKSTDKDTATAHNLYGNQWPTSKP